MERKIYTSTKEVRDFAGVGRGFNQTNTSKIKSNGIKVDIVALKYLLGCTYNLEDILKNDIREIRCRSDLTRTEVILRPNGRSDEEVVRLIVKRETSWKKGEEIVALLQSSNGVEVRLKNITLD